MGPLTPKIAVWDYDRTRQLFDGRVKIEGCDPIWLWDMPIETMFSRALGSAEFEISELSFSNFLVQVAEGRSKYVGIPAFPSRSFRHGAWFVNTDKGIERPNDLVGRRIGVREYSMTAAVVARGILSDEFDVRAESIQWVVGDVDEPERDSIVLPSLPAGFSIERAPDGSLLSEMLVRGRIDALLAYKPPKPFTTKHPKIRRLFHDYAEAEKEFAQRTAIFPIMHLMGIRKDIAAAKPELAQAVLAGFTLAKDRAIEDLATAQALKVSLPWVTSALAETMEALGEDYWPYGIRKNRAAIEAIARWHHEQGLSDRILTVEEMFCPTTLDS